MTTGYDDLTDDTLNGHHNVLVLPSPYQGPNALPFNLTFDHLWPTVHQVLNAIYNDNMVRFFRSNRRTNPVAASPNDVYQAISLMCSSCSDEERTRMYKAIGSEVDLHLNSLAADIQSVRWERVESAVVLERISLIWERHSEEMAHIANMFSRLTLNQCSGSEELLPFRHLGLVKFRDLVFRPCTQMSSRCTEAVLSLILHERKTGDSTMSVLIPDIITMLSLSKLYEEYFETPFLRTTADYYRLESKAMLDKVSISEYINHVEKRISDEKLRIKQYVHENTGLAAAKLVVQLFVEEHIDDVISKGFANLVNGHHYRQLRLLFGYVENFEQGMEKLKSAFATYIKKTGTSIVSDPAQDEFMVDRLLEFYQVLEEVVAAFGNNERFMHTMKDAYGAFLNSRPNKPAELIAKYIDARLRSGNKELSPEDLDKILDRTLVLFRFISGKDVFEAFYKKDFARRLLMGRSASIDAEKSMLSKLKQECGALFTNRLEGMLRDMELSKDIMAAYNEHFTQAPFPMIVNVLTLSYWPTYPRVDLNIPAELAQCQENFSQFYLSTHSGRRLHWQHSLCHCVLKFRSDSNGMKELQVSLFQTVVLLLFNEADKLTFTEIQQKTGIDNLNLERTLTSLCNRNAPLLKKQRGIDNEETSFSYLFNKKFTHRLFRIRINQLQTKESVEENKATTENVFQDRQFQVDAAIVRIMKSRRSINHNELIQELLSVLNFSATTEDLKKRIESLIDRDYLTRNKENPNVYIYVA